MGVKQGLDVVLDAALQTRSNPAIVYLLVGDGAMRPHLEARARALGLDNVRIVPLLDHERFLRLLAAADVCLVTQQRTVADVVFPSKVLTLLAAGKPVIASVTGGSAVANVISGAGAGMVVPPEDGDALARRDRGAPRATRRCAPAWVRPAAHTPAVTGSGRRR